MTMEVTPLHDRENRCHLAKRCVALVARLKDDELWSHYRIGS